MVLAVAAALLALPVYLWHTNYCFSEMRYVPRSEICDKYLGSWPKAWLTAQSRCVFEPTYVSAFLVYPTALSPHLYPNPQWGDLLTNYDSCGRTMKLH